MKYAFFILVSIASLLGISFPAQAQNKKYTISGYVKDQSSGEALIGATVSIRQPLKGTVTNSYGFFSLTADTGRYTLVASYIGLEPDTMQINLNRDIYLEIKLKPRELKTVVISDQKGDENVKDSRMGTVQMDMKQVKQLPQFMGEVDILKTIQLK